MTNPTLNKMVKVYVDSAAVERLKCGKPNERSVRNTLAGVRKFVRWINKNRINRGFDPFDAPGISEEVRMMGEESSSFDSSPLVSIIKPALIHKYLSDLLKIGVKPITAMSYVFQLRQLFAKWARSYYEDRGWKIPPFPPFSGRPKSPRYQRPDKEQIMKLKSWYDLLCADVENKSVRMFKSRRRLVPTNELWFAATMMLEFAMRNGDIMRLKPSNFVEHDGRTYLNYIPHKTEHSSGRMVKWPIHPRIFQQLKLVGMTIALDAEVFDALNREMRTLGFTGSKGAYELRKICIDHVYQRFGAEKAVSISGDDIRTIMHYYADPAQPNIGDLRISDLLLEGFGSQSISPTCVNNE